MNDFYNLFQSASFSVADVGYAEVGPEWRHFAASFRYVRVYYICEGEAELTLCTGRQVLKEGHLYFIPSSRTLSGNCREHLSHYFIHLVPDVLTEHFFALLVNPDGIPMDRSVADYLFGNVLRHSAGSSIHAKLVAGNSIRLILSHFFKEEGSLLNGTRDLSGFVKVFDYIDAHIGEPIRLSDLSDLMFMNQVYFSNLFKTTFGVSPQPYIQQKKLDRARLLLADPTRSISSVADALSFYDPAAFTAFFKKHTGMTPKEFRAGLSCGGR